MTYTNKGLKWNTLMILSLSASVISSCSNTKKIQKNGQYSTIELAEGIYYWRAKSKDTNPNVYEYVKLNSDNTAEYSFWSDIRVKKTGVWAFNNDTLHLEVYYHNKTFILNEGRLIETNGRVWIKE